MDDLKNASHRVSVKIICIAKSKVLLIKAKWKETFNLIGGWVDKWENLEKTIIREFEEETWNKRNGNYNLKLVHCENIQFPEWWQFDAVLNIFYLMKFENTFNVKLEDIYEKFWRFSVEELGNLKISQHSNKLLILDILQKK